MSLLREAEKCLANQKAYAGLNAFITPLQRSGSWLDRVRDADARRESGATNSVGDSLNILTVFKMKRKLKISTRRSIDRGQRQYLYSVPTDDMRLRSVG